jgi:hypothetical protein
LAVTGALPALINFFILFFVHESPSWVKEKESARTSHWATVDLFGVVIASLAALGIIYIWSPLAPCGPALSLLLTVFGLGVALWGYLLPVKKYLGRSVTAGDVLIADRAVIVRNLLVGAGLAGVALAHRRDLDRLRRPPLNGRSSRVSVLVQAEGDRPTPLPCAQGTQSRLDGQKPMVLERAVHQ